jgi:CheY-like chemotaxis protein
MTARTILFVDDDRYEMLGLVERLEAAGFDVRPVTNPSQALSMIKSGYSPSLIISDLIMAGDPDASPMSNRHVGVEFCREVRELNLTCPIIVLTVVTDTVVQNEARRYAGVLLLKPVSPNNLLRRVEEALRDQVMETV